MQFAHDIKILAHIQTKTDSTNADALAGVIDTLRLADNGDSFSQQAERLEQATRRLRSICGLDAASHNEICLMVERLDETAKSLAITSNATGY
jgi:hypothetical protein